MKKYDVYVSYSYQDEECAQKVLKVLETKRLSYCTKEQGMKVGEVWAKCISDSIKNSSVFLLLCSESSSKSQACNNELMMAIMNDSGIFPLIIDDSSPSLMPSLMGYLQTDLKNKNWPEYLSQLVLKIRERDSNVDFELGSASASKYEEGNTCKADTWRSRCIGQDQKDALLKLSCDKQSLVYLDGDFLCEIGAKEVVKVPIEYGAYVLGFEDKEAPDSYRVVSVEIDKGQTSKSVIVEMPKDINAKRKPIAMRNELKCFIAGSKTLKRERVAMRAVVADMYVQWKSHNLLIEAYSLDSFSHAVSDVGHQEEYNQFIDKEADAVLFVFYKTVGEVTLQELEIAINAFKRENRPEIYFYVKDGGRECKNISVLKKKLSEVKAYWVDYSTMDDLATAFEKDLNNLIVNKVYIKNAL